jgi:hypothetical protein
MHPLADPMRLNQAWCETAALMTRATFDAWSTAGAQMMSFWTGAAAPQPAATRYGNDNWFSLGSMAVPFAVPTMPMSFMPTTPPLGWGFNPWLAFSQFGSANPFASYLANAAETMSRAADVYAPEPRQDRSNSKGVALVDVAYRGAGGYAVPQSIKFTAEVPVSTLAALWGWPFATQRFA